MKLVWINLQKNVERKEYMCAQFDKYMLMNERYHAITPKDLSNVAKYSYAFVNTYNIKLSEIACMCSHLLVLHQNKHHDYLVVMEDDLELNDNVCHLQKYIENAPIDWEILQLHYVSVEHKRDDNNMWRKWLPTNFSTAFYIINQKGMNKVLRRFWKRNLCYFKSIRGPIQADKLIYETCVTYTIAKPICFTNLDFDSDIQINQMHKDMFLNFNKMYE